MAKPSRPVHAFWPGSFCNQNHEIGDLTSTEGMMQSVGAYFLYVTIWHIALHAVHCECVAVTSGTPQSCLSMCSSWSHIGGCVCGMLGQSCIVRIQVLAGWQPHEPL